MGRKRKTRWRRLSIGEISGNEDEGEELMSGGIATRSLNSSQNHSPVHKTYNNNNNSNIIMTKGSTPLHSSINNMSDHHSGKSPSPLSNGENSMHPNDQSQAPTSNGYHNNGQPQNQENYRHTHYESHYDRYHYHKDNHRPPSSYYNGYEGGSRGGYHGGGPHKEYHGGYHQGYHPSSYRGGSYNGYGNRNSGNYNHNSPGNGSSSNGSGSEGYNGSSGEYQYSSHHHHHHPPSRSYGPGRFRRSRSYPASNYYYPSGAPNNATDNTNKPSYNQDEYTKITTPRQDVLFKKGYLSQKKPQSSSVDSTSTATTPPASTNSTPDTQSTNGINSDYSEGFENGETDCVIPYNDDAYYYGPAPEAVFTDPTTGQVFYGHCSTNGEYYDAYPMMVAGYPAAVYYPVPYPIDWNGVPGPAMYPAMMAVPPLQAHAGPSQPLHPQNGSHVEEILDNPPSLQDGETSAPSSESNKSGTTNDATASETSSSSSSSETTDSPLPSPTGEQTGKAAKEASADGAGNNKTPSNSSSRLSEEKAKYVPPKSKSSPTQPQPTSSSSTTKEVNEPKDKSRQQKKATEKATTDNNNSSKSQKRDKPGEITLSSKAQHPNKKTPDSSSTVSTISSPNSSAPVSPPGAVNALNSNGAVVMVTYASTVASGGNSNNHGPPQNYNSHNNHQIRYPGPPPPTQQMVGPPPQFHHGPPPPALQHMHPHGPPHPMMGPPHPSHYTHIFPSHPPPMPGGGFVYAGPPPVYNGVASADTDSSPSSKKRKKKRKEKDKDQGQEDDDDEGQLTDEANGSSTTSTSEQEPTQNNNSTTTKNSPKLKLISKDKDSQPIVNCMQIEIENPTPKNNINIISRSSSTTSSNSSSSSSSVGDPTPHLIKDSVKLKASKKPIEQESQTKSKSKSKKKRKNKSKKCNSLNSEEMKEKCKDVAIDTIKSSKNSHKLSLNEARETMEMTPAHDDDIPSKFKSTEIEKKSENESSGTIEEGESKSNSKPSHHENQQSNNILEEKQVLVTSKPVPSDLDLNNLVDELLADVAENSEPNSPSTDSLNTNQSMLGSEGVAVISISESELIMMNMPRTTSIDEVEDDLPEEEEPKVKVSSSAAAVESNNKDNVSNQTLVEVVDISTSISGVEQLREGDIATLLVDTNSSRHEDPKVSQEAEPVTMTREEEEEGKKGESGLAEQKKENVTDLGQLEVTKVQTVQSETDLQPGSITLAVSQWLKNSGDDALLVLSGDEGDLSLSEDEFEEEEEEQDTTINKQSTNQKNVYCNPWAVPSNKEDTMKDGTYSSPRVADATTTTTTMKKEAIKSSDQDSTKTKIINQTLSSTTPSQIPTTSTTTADRKVNYTDCEDSGYEQSSPEEIHDSDSSPERKKSGQSIHPQSFTLSEDTNPEEICDPQKFSKYYQLGVALDMDQGIDSEGDHVQEEEKDFLKVMMKRNKKLERKQNPKTFQEEDHVILKGFYDQDEDEEIGTFVSTPKAEADNSSSSLNHIYVNPLSLAKELVDSSALSGQPLSSSWDVDSYEDDLPLYESPPSAEIPVYNHLTPQRKIIRRKFGSDAAAVSSAICCSIQ